MGRYRVRINPERMGGTRETDGGDNDSSLGWVVAERPGLDVLTTEPSDANDTSVGSSRKVVGAHVLVPHVEESIAVDGECGSLAIELEDDESRVVSCEGIYASVVAGRNQYD